MRLIERLFIMIIAVSFNILTYALPTNILNNRINQFSLKLFQQLSTTTKRNLVVSPYGITNVFAMLYSGSSGITRQQLANVFQFNADDRVNIKFFQITNQQLQNNNNQQGDTLAIANALWGQQGITISPYYLQILQKFNSTLFQVNFADQQTTANQINRWVKQKTNGLIDQFIQPGILGSNTHLALLNAIYFNANWANQFEKSASNQHALFYSATTQTVAAVMMSQSNNFPYFFTSTLQLISLPYSSQRLSMIILLPDQSISLEKFIQSLTLQRLNSLLMSLKPTVVRVFLPRFAFDNTLILNKSLQQLGITSAFTPTANFSRINQQVPLYLSAVLQKTLIKVTEQGTTAAAASAAIMNRMAIMRPCTVFKADHPFVFLIRDNSNGLILFIGQVFDPDTTKI